MNGNTEVLEVLRGMWGEMKTLNSRVNGTNERLEALRGDVERGFGELRGDVQTLGRRIDNVLLGAHGDEHAELRGRVTRIEQHVGPFRRPRADAGVTGRAPRRRSRDADAGDAARERAEALGGGSREVDDAADRTGAVVDAYHHAPVAGSTTRTRVPKGLCAAVARMSKNSPLAVVRP